MATATDVRDEVVLELAVHRPWLPTAPLNSVLSSSDDYKIQER